MNIKDRIFKSSVYGLISHVLRIGIAFALVPFLMKSLGQEGYGLWLLIVATLGWFRFVDFGFSAAVQRNIAIALEANDNARINTIFSCSIVLFGILGLIAGGLLFAFSYFPQLLGVDSQHFNTVHVAFMVLSIKLVWDLGMCSFHGFYSGMIRYDVDTNIDMANEIIRGLLIVLLVGEFHIYGVIFATMVSDFSTNVAKIYFAKKLFPSFKFDRLLISWQEFKHLYSYSKHVVAISIATGLSNSVDSLIISHLLGLRFVAIYGIAARLVGFAETAFSVVLNTFLPVFTRLIERKGDIRPELEEVFSLNLFLVSIFFVPLMIFSNDFIFLWLGDGYQETHIIVIAVSIAAICRAVSRPVTQLLMAKAQHKLLSIVKLAGAIINIMLSIVLGSYFGLLGIAIATIISVYFCDVILHFIIYRHYTKYPVAHLALNFIKANVLIFALSYAGFYYIQDIRQLNWIELFLASGLTFFVAMIIFWITALNKGAKEKITHIIKSKLPTGNKVSGTVD